MKIKHGFELRATRQPPRFRTETIIDYLYEARRLLIGVLRLCMPAARGVYHAQPTSAIVLGAQLPPDADVAAIEQQLWWRGLGIVVRDGLLVAGADVTVAAQQRRMRGARTFVTRQLRDAGVRGAVRRWALVKTKSRTTKTKA